MYSGGGGEVVGDVVSASLFWRAERRYRRGSRRRHPTVEAAATISSDAGVPTTVQLTMADRALESLDR